MLYFNLMGFINSRKYNDQQTIIVVVIPKRNVMEDYITLHLAI